MIIIKQFINKVKESSFWKSVMVLSSGVIAWQVIGLVTTPILSRIFTTEDYGQYGLFVSTAMIVADIAGLGLQASIMSAKDDEESKYFCTAGLIASSIVSAIVFVIMILLMPIKRFLSLECNYVFACGLAFAYGVSVNGVLMISTYVNKRKLNKVLFTNSVINALATLLITIPLGLLKSGAIGLVVAGIVANIVSIIQMIFRANPFTRLSKEKGIWKMLKQNIKLVIYQYPANLITTFSLQIPTQVLAGKFGDANLGSYSMCEKILGIPSRLIGNPISTVYFRTAAELNEEKERLAKFTLKLVIRIMLLALVFIGVTVLWGDTLFSIILGSEWAEAGKLAGFLILQYTFMLCSNCTSYCRVAIGKQSINLFVSILKLAVVIGTLVFGSIIWGTQDKMIICFSIGASLYLIVDMTVNFLCMGKYAVKYLLFSISYISFVILLWLVCM